jgi:hypothetical protein
MIVAVGSTDLIAAAQSCASALYSAGVSVHDLPGVRVQRLRVGSRGRGPIGRGERLAGEHDQSADAGRAQRLDVGRQAGVCARDQARPSEDLQVRRIRPASQVAKVQVHAELVGHFLS